MKENSVVHSYVKMVAVAILVLTGICQAQAMVLDWKGGYRAEWMELDKPALGGTGQRKAYGTHYLHLNPIIIAAEGVNVIGRFDIFGTEMDAYNQSQLGQQWGYNDRTQASSNGGNDAQSHSGTNIRASQLYLNVNNEYGSLVVGRAPRDFGLGMTYNAGNGLFDHWMDTHDVVGYKFRINNFYFMPMIGRIYDEDYGQGLNSTDEVYEFFYDSKESGSLIGLTLEKRKASDGANLTNLPAGGTLAGGWSSQRTNFVLGRDWTTFGFKFEGGFFTADTGIKDAAMRDLRVNSYGLAAEIKIRPENSSLNWDVRLGMASGDDPSTEDVNEGFQFDRNYDVAMLMFNHRLGQVDVLGTKNYRPSITNTTRTLDVFNSPDDETISNAMYLSPRMTYKWNEKLDLLTTLTYGQVLKNPTGADGFKYDLGYELDLELNYRMTEKITWSNQLGLLSPGGAFKNGINDLPIGFTYGFATRAAIQF